MRCLPETNYFMFTVLDEYDYFLIVAVALKVAQRVIRYSSLTT
jgi:hypothetical protein